MRDSVTRRYLHSMFIFQFVQNEPTAAGAQASESSGPPFEKVDSALVPLIDVETRVGHVAEGRDSRRKSRSALSFGPRSGQALLRHVLLRRSTVERAKRRLSLVFLKLLGLTPTKSEISQALSKLSILNTFAIEGVTFVPTLFVRPTIRADIRRSRGRRTSGANQRNDPMKTSRFEAQVVYFQVPTNSRTLQSDLYLSDL